MKAWCKRIVVLSMMVCTGMVVSGCGAPLIPPEGEMGQFNSKESYDAYMNGLGFLLQQKGNQTAVPGLMPQASANKAASGSSNSSPRNETITNNQEQGVDEGDIVKNIGDHLLVLRKGRLFAVQVRGNGAKKQTDSIRVAPSEDLNRNVWYDEMLVKGSNIYVIGYRYLANVEGKNKEQYDWIRGATEVSSFQLKQGKLIRKKTLFMQSNDYYSSENYTSRLVNGKLVFYMPYAAFRWVGGRGLFARKHVPSIPYFMTHKEGQTFSAIKPMFTWKDVTRPVKAPESPAFHTIVSCDLSADGDFNCKSKTFLGNYSREFYVSPSRIYLWSLPHVYSMSFKTLSTKVHAARGYIRNQFSFKETDDTLFVVVQNGNPRGTARGAHLELLKMKLSDFDTRGQQAFTSKNSQDLTPKFDNMFINKIRYVDGWFLMDYTAYQSNSKDSYKYIAAPVHGGKPVFLRGTSRLSRIEAMPGVGALFVGTSDGKMTLDIVKLGKTVKVEPSLRLQSVSEGESRSHGFFFKPSTDGGMFGLPFVGQNKSYARWYGNGISNIVFIRSDKSGKLSIVGSTSATPSATGQCETSCVDWYGNTRPIFLGSQIFGLMGSELQELSVSGNKVAKKGPTILLKK